MVIKRIRIKRIVFLLVIVFACSSVQAKTFSNPIVFGNNRITLITPTLFRLEYAEDGKFIDAPTMFAYNDRSKHLLKDFQVRDLGNGRYEITTSALRMVYDHDDFPFGIHNFNVFYQCDGKEKKFTNRNIQKGNLGGAISTLDRVDHEIPLNEGILSQDGWYIIDDEGQDLLINDWLSQRPSTHVQDQYCFVYGNDYHAALRDLGAISGNVPMTRKYMHGIWYCRYWDYTSQDYIDLLNGYKVHDFPLDNMVFDMGWHTKNAKIGTGHAGSRSWTGYTWNTKLISDPQKLIKIFHDHHVTISLNDHPHDGIRPNESMYTEFMENMHATPQDIARGKNILFNMGDSIYMKNFFKAAHGGSEKIGVDFWWLDWQQNYLYDYVRGTHTKSLAWINKLYYDHSVSANRRGANYSRWAGFGSQRYPIQFSGDAVANWNMLAFEVKLTSTSGNAGCYYWAHDIGGFYGGKDPEMYARWTQFGSVSAALRVHSAKSSNIDRRPWLWGNAVLPSLRKSYHLRSQLMPYIYSSVWETHCTMVPLNRAMYIDYNDDQRAYNNPQEFMLGDLLLVAPITSPGKGERKIASQKVWFPGKEIWYDYFDSKAYKGGTEISMEKDINEFPLFVKGGYLLPLQPYTQRPASTPLKELILRCYPGEDGCNNIYTLYEDDGISRDYERGKYSLTELCYRQLGKRVKIIISGAKGSYNGQVKQRSYLIELPATKIQGKVMTNTGKAIVITDRDNGINRIFIKKEPIDKDVIIKFSMK
ncbi:DUF5110 domain-containing protein [Prevotella cerevisiae]|jgi:alpha-glucosidase (family GH31 glycosyl hydrolase)|uniref:DUF5110 domain-containing protein n=1 Tax=Segatella cerevisiae TaxID=2053716 RepID=A0ABT1BX64_9BACT|nr:TIM-barrel domain-containing protein [Segatella cerevisiae]MCO6025665.1 DUF5110 domain-containing protein [Segatella cerevisiae]